MVNQKRFHQQQEELKRDKPSSTPSNVLFKSFKELSLTLVTSMSGCATPFREPQERHEEK